MVRTSIIMNTLIKEFILSSTPNIFNTTNTAAPERHAVAYISFLKISGISLIKVSLITPPITAENIPIIMAASGETPNSSDFCTPTTV